MGKVLLLLLFRQKLESHAWLIQQNCENCEKSCLDFSFGEFVSIFSFCLLFTIFSFQKLDLLSSESVDVPFE